jgi:hypothetical protein
VVVVVPMVFSRGVEREMIMSQQMSAERCRMGELLEECEESAGTGRARRQPGGARTGSRRRHIDPTTCERDYTEDEVEFMRALDSYKRTHGRMFPTCSEILEVIRGLGYEKVAR